MKKRRRVFKIVIILIIIVLICGGAFLLYLNHQMKKLETMDIDDMLVYSTKGLEDAKITVGILKDGEMKYEVYGENGELMEPKLYDYEIGSLTKTFTGALLCKAIQEGKIDLDAPISDYIELPKQVQYPTIKSLVTHTSGYKGYYLESQMVSNFFHRQANDFYGINQDMLIQRVGKVQIKEKEYGFKYSNFGMAVLGQVLSAVYEKDYDELMKEYIEIELGLENTWLSEGENNLKGSWNWKKNDAYLPAGGIISNIEDMLSYTQIQMTEKLPYLAKGHELQKKVHGSNASYEKMGIRIDAMGIAWIIDEEHNFLWHNGGTSNYNSYLAFDQEKQVGVVLLSNLSPGKRIPVTVIGVKMMENLQKEP